jgi:uncharacterized protein with FMN-binding domain
MSRNQSTSTFNLVRALQKFVVSTFVVFTFVVYAVHEHFANADAGTDAASPTPSDITQPSSDASQVAPTAPPLVFAAPQNAQNPAPTATPPASRQAAVAPKPAATTIPKPKGQFKDGSFTGPEVDAFYGWVRVKAVVQNGRITDVQFLEYPSDRRTSVRINTVAVPYLQREAISAQSANVNFISGATLTSEAFAESLQTALSSAKN